VNVVRVKGRPYYYFHPGRGTKNAKRPIRLPDDPRSEDFWAAYGRLTNDPQRENAKSFTRLIDAYRTSPEFCDLADSTRTNYEHYLESIAAAWGNLSVDGLLPAHVLALRDKHRGTPAAANGMLRVLSVPHLLERAARFSKRQSLYARTQTQDWRRLGSVAVGDD
jgi:hypothetical protein